MRRFILFAVIVFFSVSFPAVFQGCALTPIESRGYDPVTAHFEEQKKEKVSDQIRWNTSSPVQRSQTFYSQPDIHLGMSMSTVRQAWGEPRRVQVAGRPRAGHQKWIYPASASSYLDSSGARIVYFEHGQVVGWETR